MDLSLKRPQFQIYSDGAMIEELRRVAAHYGNRRFSRREYDVVARACKGSAVIARFGSWQGALDATGLQLEPVGKNRWAISDEQLFEEMSRIWSIIGHRPSHDEWVNQSPRYSYTTYKARFGGWINACAAFVAFIAGDSSVRGEQKPVLLAPSSSSTPKTRGRDPRKRNVSEKLRYRVLARDHFKCVLCGRSPATEAGIKLHIDHIVPFARGGKTEFDNLRSVCNSCNWGKGVDLEV